MHTGRASEAGSGVDDTSRLTARAEYAEGWASVGRHAAAERLWREVAAALARRGATVACTTVQITLGRHLLERGQAIDAERVFGDAARSAEQAGERNASSSARVWQAAALTDLAQLASADSLCRTTIDAGALDQEEEQRALATHIRVLLWQERLDEAAALAERLSPQSPRVEMFVCATLVRLHLRRGEVFAAGQLAHAALTVTPGRSPMAQVIAGTTDLRLRAATGDLDGALDACRAVCGLASTVRTPLRAIRAHLICLDGLQRAGRRDEARQVATRLRRFERRVPPLLAQAIGQACCDREPGRHPMTSGTPVKASVLRCASGSHGRVVARLAIDILNAARLASEGAALGGVLRCVLEALPAVRADLWRDVAGEVHMIGSAGSGPPTSLGILVLQQGTSIGPREVVHGTEIGVPVRDGDCQVGALVVRIAPTPGGDAADLLAYAAAVVAPRLACLSAPSTDSQAAAFMPELIGGSPAMADLRRAVVRAAAAPFAVLIEGESGVGKELVARALHRLGPRCRGPFRDLNCAALPEDLLDAELFGHTRGAFTGALTDRPGLVEEADGGTLFLDEVADLSARGQAKLLRVLQEREVRRIGEARTRPVDLRVVSAANKDMRLLAANGGFRPDLLYRVAVIRIRIPPLRARPEDIVPLAKHFWADASARVGSTAVLTRKVLDALGSYSWPGNVRELQNAVAALAVSAPSRGDVRCEHLPHHGDDPTPPVRLQDARAQFERRVIQAALLDAAGNRSGAARALGLSRQGLAKLIARHRIAPHTLAT